jgi:hypothetical protein
MSSDDDGKLILYATLGFGAGIFWFFKGFKIYREYRVLLDTPEIPIRSMPMGLVEIHGKAKLAAEKLVDSPVSRTPCLFYKVEIERYVKDKDGGHWSHYKTCLNGAPFYLDDGTGKVLVNPYGAECDLIQNAKRDTGSFTTSRTNFGKLFSGIDGPAVAPASGGYVSDSELIAFATTTHSMDSSGFNFSFSAGGLSVGGLSLNLGGSGSRFRFTEYLILPEHWYDVTGTCTENPQPKDENDRNMIVRGENEPTFVISWRSEKEIEGALRRRAAKYVVGGAGLSFVCLAILLAKFGWLF